MEIIGMDGFTIPGSVLNVMSENIEHIDGLSPEGGGGVPEIPELSPPLTERAEARALSARIGKDVEACRAMIRKAKGQNAGKRLKITNMVDDGYRPQYLAKYGLTHDAYHKMWNQQGGTCAICFKLEPLQVDHSHADGHVRGLLCGPCNRGLAQFRDNPIVLVEARRYLMRNVRKIY